MILESYVHGGLFSWAMPYHRMNSLDMRENEHKQVMLDLQKWPMEISDALKKCKRLRKENKTYR